MKNLTVIKGDITLAKVDAIVNAANPVMLGGGGVDGAIHKAAGVSLLEACRAIEAVDGVRCPIGEARITEAGDLDARYVIHTVGPRYGIDPRPEKLLASAYRNSLDLALQNGCRSIAFPAISCGVYGYPIEEAAKISVDVCSQSIYSDLQIYFYLYQDDVFDVWNNLINERADRA
ncbi:MAG: O-acetyl-ADP-ribose deacetylase [Gammaproteobacteria bacterium]|nr:O-acetyl-ADP-ribose deacetylase [Gammaproteobacteria bacterium]